MKAGSPFPAHLDQEIAPVLTCCYFPPRPFWSCREFYLVTTDMEQFFLDYMDMEHGQYRLLRKCKCKNHRAQEKPRGGLAAPLLQLTIRYNSDRHYPFTSRQEPQKEKGFLFLKKKNRACENKFQKRGVSGYSSSII